MTSLTRADTATERRERRSQVLAAHVQDHQEKTRR